MFRTALLTGTANIAYAPEGTAGAGEDAGFYDRANSILSKLNIEDDAPAEGHGATDEQDDTEQHADANGEGDAQSVEGDEPEADDTASEEEAAQPAPRAQAAKPIEPPVSWKADAKEVFGKLPRDLQQVVVDRETERETHFTRKQSEVAEQTRKLDSDRTALQTERATERAKHTNSINALLAYTVQNTPALAEAEQLSGGSGNPLEGPGWIQLARTNPSEYLAKQTEAKFVLGKLHTVLGEAVQLHTQTSAADKAKADADLVAFVANESKKLEDHKEIGPVWKDPAKREAFLKNITTSLSTEGFSDQEIKGITDSRVLNVARKAMLYDQMVAEKSRIPAQRAPARPVRVVRPQASADGDGNGQTRMAAAKKQIKGMSRLDEIADVIARNL